MTGTNRLKKIAVATMITTGLGGSLMMPFAAQASESGRRNTTYALGALTAILGVKHQWIPAAITGVGTVVAEHNLQAAINKRHRQESYRYGNRRQSWQSHSR